METMLSAGNDLLLWKDAVKLQAIGIVIAILLMLLLLRGALWLGKVAYDAVQNWAQGRVDRLYP